MPQLTLAQAFARAPKKSTPESPKPVSLHKPAPKILFGPNGPHADFDQFSPHSVAYNGALYPTSQHLFQAFKFLHHRPDISEQIRTAATPQLAFDMAHSNTASARPDWFSINLSKMEEALFLKFSQHDQLKQELLSTSDAELYQDSMTDSFWGVGPDLLGSNEFGRALERVRERLGGASAPVHKVLQCRVCTFAMPVALLVHPLV
ncbi:hypothetical protein GGX14DRAFT_351261 [Mycena pura]|uniref:NADAR domain-containing protein n=1 Tax=Mycena pura TaxID=153505 RepID=A0AAD6YMZ1_9AGAR|nr:hypothetical protein GGX14DRAFT_351261 [Mycena pura]